MEFHRVESVGVQRARSRLTELLRSVEGGAHYLLLRFDQPVAALIPHGDYLRYSELNRREGLTSAFLTGRGYDPDGLSAEAFVKLLAAHLKPVKEAR